MFGFGKTKEEAIKEQRAKDDYAMDAYAEGGMHSLWGTSDPKKINQQMRKYMPELMGNIKETKDGFIIKGKCNIRPTKEDTILESFHDHRLAMSFYVAGLISEKEFGINGFEWTKISFPEFEELFALLS